MRRIGIVGAVLVAAVLVSGECFAGCPLSGGGSSEKCYVLVEKTGCDVTCNMYKTMKEVEKRGAAVMKENKATRKANQALDAEMRKIKNQVASKGAKLARTDDIAAKADLEKEIAELKAELEEKEGERKPMTKLIGPKKFRKKAKAKEYVAAVRLAAKKAAKIKAKAAEAEAGPSK